MQNVSALLVISLVGFVACALLSAVLWFKSRKEKSLFCVEAVVQLNSWNKVIHREYQPNFQKAQAALKEIKAEIRKELATSAPHIDVAGEIFSAAASFVNQHRPMCHKATGVLKAIR